MKRLPAAVAHLYTNEEGSEEPEIWRRFQEAGALNMESLVKKDWAALQARVSTLEAEVSLRNVELSSRATGGLEADPKAATMGPLEPLEALAPQKDVSVGRWEAEMGMAEITVKQGKLWGSMGVIRNSRLYCNVEEAVYMVEQGSLLLLQGNDVPISRQEVYDLLGAPSCSCSWNAYQIFCHLKRLGYIVGRHGTPWSTSRGKRPPSESSLRTSENELDKEEETDLPNLVSNLNLSDGGLTEEQGTLKLMFDVHHPNGRFRKTAPGFPAFSLCVVKGQEPPELIQMRELEARVGGRPVKLGTVDCGHVSLFSFTTCSLPTLP